MKIRRFEEEEAEENVLATQIPNDKECLLEFMDQRAKSIQLSCCREKTDGRCGDQFLQLGRVESDSLSKAKPKVPGKTGRLLDEVKTAIGTSTPYVRVVRRWSMKPLLYIHVVRRILDTTQITLMSVTLIKRGSDVVLRDKIHKELGNN
ncbi:hypothetical protein YC2023_077424 [Brassica napus]